MRCPARAADARDFPALYDLRRLDVCSHAMFCAREPTQLPITSLINQPGPTMWLAASACLVAARLLFWQVRLVSAVNIPD